MTDPSFLFKKMPVNLENIFKTLSQNQTVNLENIFKTLSQNQTVRARDLKF